MFLYLVNADLRCLLHIAVIIFFLQFQLFCHPRRSVRMSASVDAYGYSLYIFLTSSIIVFFMSSHDSLHNIFGIGCISASSK